MNPIKSISYDQEEIIKNIISLHLPLGIELDPTYSKGNFYKNINPPKYKYDLFPQSSEVIKSEASKLPHSFGSIKSIMFDPPFIAGHTKDKPTGIIGERFHGFKYMPQLLSWYTECLIEFNRILKVGGILIFKCQDTVSSGKQFFSHTYIINESERLGFYTLDLFILLAKNRIIGHNHKNQKHARKYHSYFLVFRKVENTPAEDLL